MENNNKYFCKNNNKGTYNANQNHGLIYQNRLNPTLHALLAMAARHGVSIYASNNLLIFPLPDTISRT